MNTKRKVGTVDLTPTWAQILPTWLMIARQSYRGESTDNAGNIEFFESEMRRMAEAADQWNAYAKENIRVDTAHEQGRN